MTKREIRKYKKANRTRDFLGNCAKLTKKQSLKKKKDRKREERRCSLYRKRHYKETLEYQLDCFFKEYE